MQRTRGALVRVFDFPEYAAMVLVTLYGVLLIGYAIKVFAVSRARG
ncbi:hypothetical protein GCM10010249_08880 [Streptomyces roseolilacinus]|uniref:Uncharacterized protein n=1 Tax=Streptomyces roseolilacinus TaxID=66904 RepID=A0A918AWS9_9ACTN|nr:hypothetical protein GCM10010249_08880 [Streptomyces roseolilacinus]